MNKHIETRMRTENGDRFVRPIQVGSTDLGVKQMVNTTTLVGGGGNEQDWWPWAH